MRKCKCSEHKTRSVHSSGINAAEERRKMFIAEKEEKCSKVHLKI